MNNTALLKVTHEECDIAITILRNVNPDPSDETNVFKTLEYKMLNVKNGKSEDLSLGDFIILRLQIEKYFHIEDEIIRDLLVNMFKITDARLSSDADIKVMRGRGESAAYIPSLTAI